jgi:lysophospholipase L1-like esterase
MPHLVLLGDSIFDNGVYVPGHPDVVRQVRSAFEPAGQASLVAVDGNVTRDVERQLARVPADATHLFISVGGNDALRNSGVLREAARSVGEGIQRLTDALASFRQDYRQMLAAVGALDKPTTVCTIYDSIPGLEAAAVTALGTFNEIILRAAFERGLPVIGLRLICKSPEDYSPRSPIEPSHLGGAKIAAAIATVLKEHDFSGRRTVVYP